MVVLAPAVWSNIFSVLPDQTLACLLAVAAVTGILWLDEGRRAWLVLSVVFLAAAALTKTEGVLLGSLLAVVLLGAGLVIRRRRALAGLTLLLGPLAIEPWRLWLADHHQPVSASVYSWTSLFHPEYLSDRLDRLSYATGHMVDLLVDSNRWSPILPLTLAVLVVLAPTLRALGGARRLAARRVLRPRNGLLDRHAGRPVVRRDLRLPGRPQPPLVAGAVLPLLLGIALERDRAEESAPARLEQPQPMASHYARLS